MTRIYYAGTEKIGSLTNFDSAARARIRDVINTYADLVLARARTLVSGGVLKVHSGRLLGSLQSKPYEGKYGFGTRVYASSPLAHLWEFGFGKGKSVMVKAHVRHVARHDVRAVLLTAKGGLRRKVVAKGIAFVKAHPRKIDQAARPFLKTALESYRMQIRVALMTAAKGQ